MTCIQWAIENGVAPVVRGGGHSYAGLSTTTGLMIDISALDVVTVDHATGIAQVAGAALNGDVLDKTIHTAVPAARRHLPRRRHRRARARRRHRLQHPLGRPDVRPPDVDAHRARLRRGRSRSTPPTIPTCSGPAAAGRAATSASTRRSRSSSSRRRRPSPTSATTSAVPTTPAAMLAAFHRVVQTAPAGLNASSAGAGHARRQRRPARGDRRASPAASTSARQTSCATCSAPVLAAATPDEVGVPGDAVLGRPAADLGIGATRRRTRSATVALRRASRCPTMPSPR